jgi:hypothetical protein
MPYVQQMQETQLDLLTDRNDLATLGEDLPAKAHEYLAGLLVGRRGWGGAPVDMLVDKVLNRMAQFFESVTLGHVWLAADLLNEHWRPLSAFIDLDVLRPADAPLRYSLQMPEIVPTSPLRWLYLLLLKSLKS